MDAAPLVDAIGEFLSSQAWTATLEMVVTTRAPLFAPLARVPARDRTYTDAHFAAFKARACARVRGRLSGASTAAGRAGGVGVCRRC